MDKFGSIWKFLLRKMKNEKKMLKMLNFTTKFEKWTNLDKFESIFFTASNEK